MRYVHKNYKYRVSILLFCSQEYLSLCDSVGMTSNITFGTIYTFMEIPGPARGPRSANLSGEPGPGAQVSLKTQDLEKCKPEQIEQAAQE